MTDEYTVEVWDRGQRPLGLLAVCGDLVVIERGCSVGSGQVDAIPSPENWAMIAEGAEVRVRRNGEVVQAGRITPFGQMDGMQPVIKLSWLDHLSYLDPEPAFPNPQSATGQGAEVYDRRTGFASSVIQGFVDANIGPSARVERRAPGLIMGTDPRAGAFLDAPVEARYTPLLPLCQELALVGGVQFSVVTRNGLHYFTTRAVADLSDRVRFDTALGTVRDGEWDWARPEATRVLALGAGEGTARLAIEVFTAESLRQEARWGRRVYLHDSSTEDPAALRAEAERVLAQKLETVTADYASSGIAFTPGVDYQLCDLVAVPLSGIGVTVKKPVKEIKTTVSVTGEVRVEAKAGDYDLAAGPPIRDPDRRATETARVLDGLKRSK